MFIPHIVRVANISLSCRLKVRLQYQRDITQQKESVCQPCRCWIKRKTAINREQAWSFRASSRNVTKILIQISVEFLVSFWIQPSYYYHVWWSNVFIILRLGLEVLFYWQLPREVTCINGCLMPHNFTYMKKVKEWSIKQQSKFLDISFIIQLSCA